MDEVLRMREEVNTVCDRGRSLVSSATDDQHRETMETAMRMLQEKAEAVSLAAESRRTQLEVTSSCT